jgi:hypothetical protein
MIFPSLIDISFTLYMVLSTFFIPYIEKLTFFGTYSGILYTNVGFLYDIVGISYVPEMTLFSISFGINELHAWHG